MGFYSIGALIIRIGFWDPLYYTYNKEPQTSIGNHLGPYIVCMPSHSSLV